MRQYFTYICDGYDLGIDDILETILNDTQLLHDKDDFVFEPKTCMDRYECEDSIEECKTTPKAKITITIEEIQNEDN